jgi:hypothetical protein
MENKKINIIENFLSKDECDNIINNHKNGKSLGLIHISEKIVEVLNNNFKFRGHELGELEHLSFKEYTPKTKYSLKWNINNKSYFTIIVQLNDNFDNGYYQYLLNDDEKYFQSPKITGSLVFFFSNIKHRLSPVESDFKYVLETEIKLLESHEFKKTLI